MEKVGIWLRMMGIFNILRRKFSGFANKVLGDGNLAPRISVAPLKSLPGIVRDPAQSLADQIASFPETHAFQETVAAFESYPEKSLLNPISRATLYQIIRLLKPKTGLEIGTLFAGSTEVMARAFHANGTGRLITVDPVGGHRVPGIIEQWQPELARHVEFKAVNSMQAFMDIDVAEEQLDFSFIDGNHAYEFANFDLQASSRFLKPGGVIVLDNVEQSGPFFAAKRFIESSPDWQLVGVPRHELDAAQRIDETRRSIDGSAFFILTAPEHTLIGALPLLARRPRVAETILHGIQLKLTTPATAGVLVYKLIFVSRPYDYHLKGEAVERTVTGDRISVEAGATDVSINFDPPKGFESDQSNRNRVLECTLAFYPADGISPLRVQGTPLPLLS